MLQEHIHGWSLCLRGVAVYSSTEGMDCLEGSSGEFATTGLASFMEAYTDEVVGASQPYYRWTENRLQGGRPGFRGICSFRLPRAGVTMQAVVTFTEPQFPGTDPAEVDIEELWFLEPDGTLAVIAEYGLAWSFDNSRCSTRSIRLAGTGFGRLQARPVSEAAPHFEALRVAARQQPLRNATGRWSDSLLLPAIHGAVAELYPLQLC